MSMIIIPRERKNPSCKNTLNCAPSVLIHLSIPFFHYFSKRATGVIFVFLWRKSSLQEANHRQYYTTPALLIFMILYYIAQYIPQGPLRKRRSECFNASDAVVISETQSFINKHMTDVRPILMALPGLLFPHYVAFEEQITEVSLYSRDAQRSSARYYHYEPQLVVR